MKWFYKSKFRWRLLDDNGRWLGTVWGTSEEGYYVDLASDKYPFPIRKRLGRMPLTTAKKQLIAHAVGERITK